MYKISVAVIGIISTLSSFPAEAQNYRRYDQRPNARYYAAPRYAAPRYAAPRYAAPRYARPPTNWLPYAIGGLALGALIGNYYYNNYGQVCHNEIIDFNYKNMPITGTVCE
jgi:hypothetical protein